MVGKEFMRPSSSPYGSPIDLVPKKNGTWGMCVDFKVFDSLKQKNFTSLLDHKQPFEVKTDASGNTMGKEIVIHIDHHQLQYLQSHTKLQQSRYYSWMRFLQQIHLVIKDKKGVTNKVVNMLSRSALNASIVL